MSITNADSIKVGFTGKGSQELLSAPLSPIPLPILIYQVDIANNSGSAATMGLGYKIINANYKVGLWDASETPNVVDDTEDAQNSDADDVSITTTTNNDGIIVSATEKFDLVNIVVSTAAVGSPVYAYQYWNGTAWTAFAPIVEPALDATGETALVFARPANWAKGGDTDEGVETDQYAIRIIATTAPSTAPLATSVNPVVLLDLVASVADGTSAYKSQYVRSTGMKVPPGHALVAYSSVDDQANTLYVEYSLGS